MCTVPPSFGRCVLSCPSAPTLTSLTALRPLHVWWVPRPAPPSPGLSISQAVSGKASEERCLVGSTPRSECVRLSI